MKSMQLKNDGSKNTENVEKRDFKILSLHFNIWRGMFEARIVKVYEVIDPPLVY